MKPRLTELERAVMAKLTDADVVDTIDRRCQVIEVPVSPLVYEALERFATAAGTDLEGYAVRAIAAAVEGGAPA